MQPYREQLQNLYADTEARSQFERGKIEGEFRQRLVREYPGSSFLFAQRSGQTRPVARDRRHPDQGEDNPNRKGVAGNGRV